jgi:hypothetical protein
VTEEVPLGLLVAAGGLKEQVNVIRDQVALGVSVKASETLVRLEVLIAR